MRLREYQSECIQSILNKIHSNDRHLTVMATGLGKTFVFCQLVKQLAEAHDNLKAVLIVDRVLLVEQIEEEMKRIGLNPSVYCGDLNRHEVGNITVATIQSIHQSPYRDFNLVIVDEVHCAGLDSGQSVAKKFIDQIKSKRVLGFTATPYDKGGYIYGEGRYFSDVDFSRDIFWSVTNNFLCGVTTKGSKKASINISGLRSSQGDFSQKQLAERVSEDGKIKAQVDEVMEKASGRKKIAWMCLNTEHANEVHREILRRGEKSSVIHSGVKKYKRRMYKRSFEEGDNRHMVSVMMLTKGYDYPPIDCIVCLRPTRSAALYIQMVGRGLRLSEGKSDLLFLDFGQVVEHMGPLDNVTIQKGKLTKSELVRMCPICEEICGMGKSCPSCGYEFLKEEIERLDRDRNLTKNASEANMLGPSIKTIPVFNMDMDNYESKSGNNVLRLKLAYVYSYIDFNSQWTSTREKAESIWIKLKGKTPCPSSNQEAMKRKDELIKPKSIEVKSAKYLTIEKYIY